MVNEGRTEAYEPTPEGYTGAVLPGGRGTELHGVPWESGDPEAEYWHGERVAIAPDYLAPEDEPTPIPVKIVHSYAREETHWRTYRISLRSGEQTSFVGREDKRTALTIKLLSGAVSIGDEMNNATAVSGYPLAVGDTFSTDAVNPVYGTASEDSVIAVLATHRVEL